LSYAKIEDGKYLEITFTSPVNINHDTSQDQDLSYNGIYRSDAGEFLLYFDTSALTPDEWNELSRTATEYVEEKA
jgi:predicted ATP-grasp superfamily ATP-dependent carboligase